MGHAKGETVVHPQHGVAVVAAIFTKDLGRGPVRYLELHVDSGALKILVPATSVEEIGIRSLSSRQDAEAILSLLEEESDVPVEWTQRNASTMSRMRSRNLDEIAMVVRDLLRHQRRIGKPLNLGEKGALDKCLGVLARELSLSLDLTEEETLVLLAERGSIDRAVSDDALEPVSVDKAG